MTSLANSLARAYSESRGGVVISVQTFDSEVGLTAPLQSDVTIGMVSRAIKPAELDQLRAVVIGRDGVAVLVNDQNPINAIKHSQVTQIFSGEILTWPAGPMAGKPIFVISREQGSGTRKMFEAMLMNNLHVTLTALVMPGEAAVVDYIAQHPDAIGYTSMAAIVPGVHSLAVDDVHLSPSSVESGQYPLVRTLSLITRVEPRPEVQAFVDFAQSPEGQAIVGQKFGRAPSN
jgi:phosphate transport system substrate-binding protein